MKLFLLYLKRHCKIMLLLLLFGSIFASVFSLYALPVEAVIYSLALCAFVGLAMFAAGFALHLVQRK